MLFYLTAVITIIADRITKYFVVKEMVLGQSIPVIHNWLHLTYVNNPGAAFGMLANKRWFFVVATVLMIAVLVYYARTMGSRSKLLLMALGMITGGAVGNFVDRLRMGYVVDFLDFRGIWPYIFNIADAAIVVGAIFMAWYLLRTEFK